MGILDFLQRKTLPPTAAPQLPELARGSESNVAGESFYPKSFRRLARKLGNGPKSETLAEIELRADPTNRFSKSGKAVGVWCLGLQLGHIPEQVAPEVFDKIRTRGWSARCSGRIWFDQFRRERPKHSVNLFIHPVHWADEPSPLSQARSSTYARVDEIHHESLDAQRQDRKRGWSPELPKLKKGDEVTITQLSLPDEEFLQAVLQPHGIKVEHRITKSRTSVVVVPQNEVWESSAELDKALIWNKPHSILGEFFERYPELSPKPEMLESKRLADEWLATRSQPAEMAAARAQIAAAARKGPVVLRGLAYAETLPFRFGLFDGRVLKEHKQTVRKLLENNGARLWDRLILPGALGLQVDQENFVFAVDDEPVAQVQVEDKSWFSSAIRDFQSNALLLDICWQRPNKFQVSAQTNIGASGED